MYVSEDVDRHDSRLDELARQSLDIQKVKSYIAEIHKEMCKDIKKATKCMEEKLGALLVKLREKEN